MMFTPFYVEDAIKRRLIYVCVLLSFSMEMSFKNDKRALRSLREMYTVLILWAPNVRLFSFPLASEQGVFAYCSGLLWGRLVYS